MIRIYTHGACKGNPGVSGWAAVLVHPRRRKTLQGSSPHTTNNRMEFTAALEGLRALDRPSEVHKVLPMLRAENAASRRASVQVPACKSTSVGAVGGFVEKRLILPVFSVVFLLLLSCGEEQGGGETSQAGTAEPPQPATSAATDCDITNQAGRYPLA